MRSVRLALLGLAISLAAVTQLASANALELAQAQNPVPVEGEVTRVNKDTQKLTIRHGPLPHLDMPAMTMVYAVKDPALLDKVKAGSKITFTADKIDGTFTVLSTKSAERAGNTRIRRAWGGPCGAGS